MRFGLFSNGQRLNEVARISYDEDLYEVVLADKLGFDEAWISEHGTFVSFQAPDQLPCADLFICKAAALTKRIRLGPGIRALPFYHPLQIATEAAVCDHLTNGRYMAGFGLGLAADSQQRGPLPAPPRAMVREAIELILKAWSADAPFDWNGEIWQGKGWHIIPKPLTRFEVGLACSKTDTTLELAAEKGFLPLMSWTGTAGHLAEMSRIYLGAHPCPTQPPDRSRIRVPRFVYVADSVAAAKRDLAGADLGGALTGGRLDAFIPPGRSRADVTIEHLIDAGLFICGDPDTVYRGIEALYEGIGGFGVLLLVVGKDWATRQKRARSMRRFMKEVAPRLTALNPAAAAA